jgi:hypothetical protein
MKKDIDYSFKILEEILTFKKYQNREEVMHVGKVMLDKAMEKDCPQAYKDAYQEAYRKLDSLNFDEMNEIIDILASNND